MEKTMKNIFVILLFSVLFVSTASATAPFTEIKVGYFYPEDAKAGVIWGINLGQMIDESLSWSFEFNYYQKTYSKVTTIQDTGFQSGITPRVVQEELNYKTFIIPFFLKLNWEKQLAYKSPFFIRASGGLGWEMVWNKESNYFTGNFPTRFYHGFGWQGNLGIGYQISSSANLFIDGLYNGSKAKRKKGTTEAGLPTWEELNISGFGVRVGVSIVGFGW